MQAADGYMIVETSVVIHIYRRKQTVLIGRYGAYMVCMITHVCICVVRCGSTR